MNVTVYLRAIVIRGQHSHTASLIRTFLAEPRNYIAFYSAPLKWRGDRPSLKQATREPSRSPLLHEITNAINHGGRLVTSLIKCRFYAVVSEVYQFIKQDIPRAMYFSQAGLVLSISIGNIDRQAQALRQLAGIEYQTGDYSAAQVHAYESRRLAKISADLYEEAAGLRLEAMCWDFFGHYRHSMSLYQQAAHLLQLCGMSGCELDSTIMSNQADLHRVKSEYVEARDIQTQLLPKLEHGPHWHDFILVNIAQTDVEMGASKDDVQKNIHAATLRLNATGNTQGLIYCDTIRAALDMREGDLLAAKTLFQKTLEFTWARDSEAASYCLEKLANVRVWSTLVQTSFTQPVTFLVYVFRKKMRLEIHKALQFLGDMYFAEGDHQTAISLFTVALDGFTQMDVHRSKAECMLRLGDIGKHDGDLLKARELWNKARPLFERSVQTDQVANIDQRLAEISNIGEANSRPLVHLLDLTAPTESAKELDVVPADTI
ncbi:hypothetical protein FB451DRAFT_1183942 [Mycena latifolia]|nr:hypothetical protein FB451DRAFT_1183942 [Mycena latifolia]